MTYELWDTSSGNAIGEFPTEAEALAAVRELLVDRGSRAAEGLLLARTGAGGRTRPVARGRALADLALEEGAAPPSQRSTVPA